MVAQTKADARSVAGKPDVTDKKWLQQDASSGKDLDEQVAAAAVVDADQAQTVADTGVVPTDAPVDGVGLLAQTTMTPADPPADPSTTGTTGTTPPPEVEEPGTMSPWIVGGAAILGFGAVAAIVDNNDDDDDSPIGEAPPPSAPEPGPAPGPAPTPAPGPGPAPVPAPVDAPPTSQDSTVTTAADGMTPLSAVNFPFTDTDTGDARTGVRIDTITSTGVAPASDALAINAATGHGYELISAPEGGTGFTWGQASEAAALRGGYLAVLDSAEELGFVKANLGDLGDPGGLAATWVGLSQAPTATAVGEGWSWVNGTNLPGDSPLWSDAFGEGSLPGDFRDEPFEVGRENHEADFGAISEGGAPDQTANSLILDSGLGAGTDVQPRFVIEYNTTAPLVLGEGLDARAVLPNEVIQEAQLADLNWNSVFNTGGTVTYAVSDGEAFSTPDNTLTFTAPAATAQALSAMIDDQSANNLV